MGTHAVVFYLDSGGITAMGYQIEQWARKNPLKAAILVGIAVPVITVALSWLYNTLTSGERVSTFRATLSDRCHDPPNVGRFVQ